MNSTTLFMIGVAIALMVLAVIGIRFYKKKNITKLFEQIYANAKAVPKQKKKSFILLMLVETMSATSKKARIAQAGKLNNPKYIEVQMIQMSRILSDKAEIKDKATKRSLALLNDYLAWESEQKKTK